MRSANAKSTPAVVPTPLLPSKVPGPASTPKPRIDIKDDYVQVKQPVPSKDDELELPVQPPASSPPPVFVSIPDAKELAAARDEIRRAAASRLTRGLGPNSLQRKSFQIPWVGNLPNGVDTNYALTRIAPGNSSNQRLTGCIAIRHVNIKLTISRLASLLASPWECPNFCYIMFRDVIPTVGGTAPAVWATDTNPTGGTDSVLSRLNQLAAFNAVAVQNRVFAPLYPIHLCGHKALNSAGGTVSNGNFVGPIQNAWNFEWNIPFGPRECVQNYNDASNIPITNDLWLSFTTDIVYPVGVNDAINMVTSVEFEDIPDDIANA